MVLRPVVLTPAPSFLIILPAGAAATLLMMAVLHAAPSAGLPLIDLPRLVGGLFTRDPAVAFWLGHVLVLLGGIAVFGPLLVTSWTALPGSRVRLSGAALKGIVYGGALWLVTGLVLPILGMLQRVPDLANPGFLALGLGLGGALVLLIACALYGLAAALIAGMEHGISLIDVIGSGYTHGATGPRHFGMHRSIEGAPEGARAGWAHPGQQ